MKTDTHRGLTRQAYIDEQLSLDQTIAFEESLTPGEKRDIETDRALEQAIATALGREIKCPDALWERLQKQIEAESASTPWQSWFRREHWPKLAAAAAVVVVGLVAAIMLWHPASPDVAHISETVDQLLADSPIPGDFEKVAGALANNAFYLHMTPPGEAVTPHHIELVGMKILHLKDTVIAQVNFNCCGNPVMVFIVPRTSTLTPHDICPGKWPCEWFMGSREIDNYRLTAVSPHDVKSVLDLFS